MTMSLCPNSHNRSAAQNPAEPVPTTTVLAETTGTCLPAIHSTSGSWLLMGALLGQTAAVFDPDDRPLGSEAWNVHAAVDMEDLTGGVRRLARHEHPDDPADVGGATPARHRRQTAGEKRVVLLGRSRGHVGGDD